jgi:hypothetical protein
MIFDRDAIFARERKRLRCLSYPSRSKDPIILVREGPAGRAA